MLISFNMSDLCDAKLNIKIIVGSTREARFSDKAAAWITGEIRKQKEIEVEALDLRDYDMPFYNEPVKNKAVARFTKKIAEGDAFVIVTPEYNHGTSGVLKNALDWVYPEWNNKPVAFVSYGSVGGARAVEQLRLNTIELQMTPIRQAIHIPQHWTLLDEKGNLKEGALESFTKSAEAMMVQLIWWAGALKVARESNAK